MFQAVSWISTTEPDSVAEKSPLRSVPGQKRHDLPRLFFKKFRRLQVTTLPRDQILGGAP